ncbi:hypothetical protein HPB50_028650 [Hyalomma asiaticum]|nr:hypothetical protein HPB50_028650 [Hyalomma asiaticum]
MERDQTDLIKSVDELKKTQANFQENLTVFHKRLTEVERKTVALEEVEEEIQRLRQSISHASSENDQLRAKQVELEDMQWRDNLLFYGIPDAQSESWAQSEDKLKNVLSSRHYTFNIQGHSVTVFPQQSGDEEADDELVTVVVVVSGDPVTPPAAAGPLERPQYGDRCKNKLRHNIAT